MQRPKPAAYTDEDLVSIKAMAEWCRERDFLTFLKGRLERNKDPQTFHRQSRHDRVLKMTRRLKKSLQEARVIPSGNVSDSGPKLCYSEGFWTDRNPILVALNNLQAVSTIKKHSRLGGKPFLASFKRVLDHHRPGQEYAKRRLCVKIGRQARALKTLLAKIMLDTPGIKLHDYRPDPARPRNSPECIWHKGAPIDLILENLLYIYSTPVPDWFLRRFGWRGENLLHKYRLPTKGCHLLGKPEANPNDKITQWRYKLRKGRPPKNLALYLLVPGLALYTQLKAGKPQWHWIKQWLYDALEIECDDVYHWWRDNIGSLTMDGFQKLLVPRHDAILLSISAYPHWLRSAGKKESRKYYALVFNRHPWFPMNWVNPNDRWDAPPET